ncbi:hypothetical protein LUR56_39300, partial [Streptomyces sp. MT29]|nr:hypothetical protein [Streptomyces sp. MT29]
ESVCGGENPGVINRRPLGTGPAPAVDNQGAPPGKAVPRAVLAAERLDGVAAARPCPGLPGDARSAPAPPPASEGRGPRPDGRPRLCA